MVRRGRAQGLLTILFTDIEASTAMTQRMGDARAQEIVRAHNTIVRREVQSRGGTEIKHTGDGIMATFPSAARAVAAAVAIQEGTRAYSEANPATAFQVNSGLNAGEPVAEDADVFGTAVQLAARTCAEAHGGQILATNVVRELVYGKGALFDDIGATSLKGYEQPIHLYEVGVGADGIDEGASAGRNRLLPMLAIGGAVAVLAVGGAAFVLLGGGSGSDPAQSTGEYRELRFESHYDYAVEPVGGSCETNDLLMEGRGIGEVTGDLVGHFEGISNVRLLEECGRVDVDSTQAVEDEAGNRINVRSVTIIIPRIGEIRGGIDVGTTQEIKTIGVITDGAGIYSGANGTWKCDLVSTLQPNQHSLLAGDCVLRVTIDELTLAEIAVDANRSRLGVSANSRAEPDTVQLRGVYMTNEAALTGMTMRLITPDGVELAVEDASPAGSDPGGALGWDLPAAGPGEPVLFAITARLRSATPDAFDLYVEIDANELSQPIRSAAIPLTVVR